MRGWYTHGWNTTTSLRLILAVIPRMPRWLVPFFGAATALVCMVSMKRERKAARRNLRRILGTGGFRLYRTLWSLFYNFSRFMVSYCELPHLTAERLGSRLTTDPAGTERIGDALTRGNGVIVLTAHFGNWEVGARSLEVHGVPVNIVMQVDRASAAERWLMRLRKEGAKRVLPVGGDPAAGLALRAALARNEILAMQGDRASGDGAVAVEVFGSPFRFPVGPFLLAYLCGSPLLPAFVVQDGWWRWRAEVLPQVAFPRTGDRDADLLEGVASYARCLEQAVRRHPDQWFNFFDLWPREQAERAGFRSLRRQDRRSA